MSAPLPSASIIIVSRNRPDALVRCLRGVQQLTHPNFETVVVADAAGQEALRAANFINDIKFVDFDIANISQARNLGISQAAGEIIAFIDDDSVPERHWLSHLCAAFAAPDIAAATGYVRGRNGISFQWRASSITPAGERVPIDLATPDPVVLAPTPERAIKTEGTNMAFRRDIITDLGGFDPAYRFFLDETDLNMRIAAQGWKTAIVPLAEVHHGFFASAHRAPNRAPRDLFEIGASKAVFLRKYLEESHHEAAWAQFQDQQRKRCLAHMVQGQLEPRDVRRLMARLQAGFEEGCARKITRLPHISRAPEGLRPSPNGANAPSVAIYGRLWHRRAQRRRARAQAKQGATISVFRFSHTALFHRMRFHKDGYWEQIGGLFGRSERSQPIFRFTTLRKRVTAEQNRLALQRGFDETHRV